MTENLIQMRPKQSNKLTCSVFKPTSSLILIKISLERFCFLLSRASQQQLHCDFGSGNPCCGGRGCLPHCRVLASLASVQFSSVQSLSHVWLFVTPWIAACQASLSITNTWSSLRLTSIESVMPSSHLILCHPLLLLPPIPPSIRVFSKESTPVSADNTTFPHR